MNILAKYLASVNIVILNRTELQYFRTHVGFSSIVGYYRHPSIPEAPAWLHVLENVTNIYIRKVMSYEWVK